MMNTKLLIAGAIGVGIGCSLIKCKEVRHLKLLDDTVKDIRSVVIINNEEVSLTPFVAMHTIVQAGDTPSGGWWGTTYHSSLSGDIECIASLGNLPGHMFGVDSEVVGVEIAKLTWNPIVIYYKNTEVLRFPATTTSVPSVGYGGFNVKDGVLI